MTRGDAVLREADPADVEMAMATRNDEAKAAEEAPAASPERSRWAAAARQR
jgi:hypothetical protein